MPRTAQEVMSQEFLQIRAKILEIAAFYDRIAETDDPAGEAQQLELLQAGCRILDDQQPDKAARVQLLFSREYDQQWRKKFGL